MEELGRMEEQVPTLELDLHTILAAGPDQQRREGPALIQRLQKLHEAGFAEVGPTLAQAAALGGGE